MTVLGMPGGYPYTAAPYAYRGHRPQRALPRTLRPTPASSPLFEGESLSGELQSLVDSGEAKPALRKLAVTHEDGRRVIVAGLGKREELDPEKARVAAAVVASRAKELGTSSLSWDAPEGDRRRDRGGDAARALQVRPLQVGRRRRRRRGPSLEIAGDHADEAEVAAARITGEAQNRARDLQNLPSNVATPLYLAERAAEIADEHESLEVELLDGEAIVARGMGAFACVAQGTYAEPRLIVLRYDGGGDGPHLGFVGKAVTFDTGGISIKPAGKMHEMKFDMSGGAAVLESVAAIAELGLPVRITAVVPATENMPSGRAVKPGDIVTAMNGKTIEVNNTDAEGRLILADSLAYVVEQGAERIVDLATLTGAIIVALGSTYAGVFSNDDEWCAQVEAAMTDTGELGWRMPLHPEIFELTKGQYADLTNAAAERKAMSSYAAEFLRQFVDDTPWVHLDIAGTAWGLGRPYVGKGASGFGVRLLVELAKNSA